MASSFFADRDVPNCNMVLFHFEWVEVLTAV